MSASSYYAITLRPGEALGILAGGALCVFMGTLTEVGTLGLAPPASFALGYMNHANEEMNHKRILVREFKKEVWETLINNLGGREVPEFLERLNPLN